MSQGLSAFYLSTHVWAHPICNSKSLANIRLSYPISINPEINKATKKAQHKKALLLY